MVCWFQDFLEAWVLVLHGLNEIRIRTYNAIYLLNSCFLFCDSILKVEESLSRELQIERDKNKSLIERVSSTKIC